jgi:exopolyphosphatase/guanosine-5'-triphosphate,3'-diphosphate pyrophosphatase
VIAASDFAWPAESAGPRFGRCDVVSRDLDVIAGQLGRPPRDLTGVAVRCPFGYPAVVETAPVLTGGAPNPTLLYLTCPSLTTLASRAEAGGAVRAFKSWVGADSDARCALEQIARLYRERRAALAGDRASDARLDAGIGGPQGPELASCLHAYAAALLAVMSGWLAGSPGADTYGAAARASDARRMWTTFLPELEESWCGDGRCGRWRSGEKRAAIDVGTISVRLLVAEMVGGEARELARRAEVTRLGEGLQRGGRLSEDAKRRTAAVVAQYVSEARSREVDRIVLAGTSAAREAVDGRDFMGSLGRENDVPAVVLSGREEAELAYAGATVDVAGDVVVIDVGGGSTELIRRSGAGALDAVSLELGASRGTECWITSDPPAPGEVTRIREEAEGAIGPLEPRFGRCVESHGGLGHRPGSPRLVGVAGTVTTLACLDAGLEAYDHEALHLRTLSAAGVRALVTRLSAMTVVERAALPCVQQGRAPVIVAGAVILLAAMETLGYEELTVSERDLLDGLVLRGAC